MSHTRLGHLVSGPTVFLLTLATLLTPYFAGPAAAQGADQACIAPAADTAGDDSPFVQDQWKYSYEVTLTHGTVIGYQDYWTEEANSTAEIFRATSDDGLFMAGDYPAGTSLETVWSELCLVLLEMGSIIETGTDADGHIYALMILPGDGGAQRYGLVRALYSTGSDVPVFAIFQAPAETFYIGDGNSVGVGINGRPAFEGLDEEAILASLQAGGSAGTQPSGSTNAPAEETTPVNSAAGNEFESVNGTVFAYPADWSADPSMSAPDGIQLQAGDATLVLGDMAEDQDGETLFNDLTSTLPQIVDQGPTPDGGYYGLAYGQDNGGRNFYILFRFLHAAGTGTPVVVMLAAPTDTFGESLTLAHGVTANGQPVLEGLDDAVTLATLEGGGPTGEPVFTGGQASDPVPTEEPAPSAVGTEIEAPSGTLISWTEA